MKISDLFKRKKTEVLDHRSERRTALARQRQPAEILSLAEYEALLREQHQRQWQGRQATPAEIIEELRRQAQSLDGARVSRSPAR